MSSPLSRILGRDLGRRAIIIFLWARFSIISPGGVGSAHGSSLQSGGAIMKYLWVSLGLGHGAESEVAAGRSENGTRRVGECESKQRKKVTAK